jgi:lysophospholipase L1-like esterase
MSFHAFVPSALQLALGVVALGAIVQQATAAEWPADDRRVSYEGRYAVGAQHEVRLGFPGIAVRVRVSATSLRVKIHASSDDVYFAVTLDGGAPRSVRLQKGDNWVPLFSGAAAATHVVELFRMTESWQGVCEIVSFEAQGGELLEPPALPTRKLMFIGDSVTCGEGVVPNGPGKTSAERTNAADAYGEILARRLGAQCHLVSYGGRGIIRDWQGIRATNNAPQFYELALPDDPTARWNHAAYVPEAIGICLGTNDFSQGVPDQNEFVNAFVEFVRKVQRDAPNAQIILIDSPILNDGEHQPPKRTACGAYLDEIVQKVGSPNVRHATVKHYNGSEGDGHPTAVEHTAMADELEPVFRQVLGW